MKTWRGRPARLYRRRLGYPGRRGRASSFRWPSVCLQPRRSIAHNIINSLDPNASPWCSVCVSEDGFFFLRGFNKLNKNQIPLRRLTITKSPCTRRVVVVLLYFVFPPAPGPARRCVIFRAFFTKAPKSWTQQVSAVILQIDDSAMRNDCGIRSIITWWILVVVHTCSSYPRA